MRAIALTTTIAGLAALAIAAPASAKTYSFRATLNGTRPPTVTGSPAIGTAKVRVDEKTRRVSIDLDVTGITLDQLSDALLTSPIGPVQFDEYRSAADSETVLPVPYGTKAYRATKTGFRLSAANVDFDAGVKAANSGATLEEFIDAARAGKLILNVHTDKFADGEISGVLNGG